MNWDFIPLIEETLGASPYKIRQYAGTPKSLDNTMEHLWQDSSQAEFMIKCHHGGCNEWNTPALSHDLMDMLGPWTREIGPDRAGLTCCVCRKPLDPRRFGRWVHAYPERRWSFVGYHIPQCIMPMHYANQEAWDALIGKSQGKGNTTTTMFLNECCGESCDTGSKLVTVTDLKAAANLPWKRDWKAITKINALKKRYRLKVLAVDWGGGGGTVSKSKKDADKRLRTSFTSMAALGIRTDSPKIDCLWGTRSLRTHDMEYEARLVMEATIKMGCAYVVHDYGGAGAAREHLMTGAGFPFQQIIPVAYQPGPRTNIMQCHPATEDHPRTYYTVDKSRSLVLTCQAIKYGLLNFFEYDFVSADEPGLLHDFMALQEEVIDSQLGTNVYRITRNPALPDDFAQAVNIGCCALWYLTETWPDIADAAKFEIPEEILARLHPRRKIDWDDII